MVDFEVLNQKLVDAESVISSKYHFRFSDLKLEDIDSSDIMISVLQTRVIAEGICRFIVLQEHLVKDEKSIRTATLKVYVDDLLRPNLLVPKAIISNLSTIQGISNLAVHYQVDGHLNKEQAYICLESLEQVLEWFVKKYQSYNLKQGKWKIATDVLNVSGAVPPKAEGCLLSREREVEELRKLMLSNKVVILWGNTGVGKTELVKDYVKKYRKKYDGVYYAENVKTIEDYLYNLPVGILNEELKTKDEIVSEKLEVIHSMELTYLFVIDNFCGSEETIQSLYPLEWEKYHILVVVGEENLFATSSSCYELNTFSLGESLQLFRYYCDEKYTDGQVEELIKFLSFNPRAIKMSALFLRDNTIFSPERLMDGMRKNTSVKSIFRNLYIVLTEISILESDNILRWIAECLSLIPYNGMSKERFENLFLGITTISCQKNEFENAWNKLVAAGWMSVDHAGYISINPLLSDTLYEKTSPDMSSERIIEFLSPILKPIKEIRELYLSQVLALAPFVEHLTNRILESKSCDWEMLNELREYYIAIYDVEMVEKLTGLMENEFKYYIEKHGENVVENAIYRQGISRFNLEDFQEAHNNFSRALKMLEQRIVCTQKDIARICAYEATSLAALGKIEEAIKCAKKSIALRQELSASGEIEEGKKLWISHYNYAKVFLESAIYENAMVECETAIALYKDLYPIEYTECRSTNVSSLLHLKGRIHAALGEYEEAIILLEKAKGIREKLKGDTYFSTAQVYFYLMEVYAGKGEYYQALIYAQKYLDVLMLQYRTQDIEKKIKDVEHKISMYEEMM